MIMMLVSSLHVQHHLIVLSSSTQSMKEAPSEYSTYKDMERKLPPRSVRDTQKTFYSSRFIHFQFPISFSNTMALLQEEDDFFGAHDDDDEHDDDNPSLRQCIDGHELHSGLAVADFNASKSHYQTLGYHAAYDEHKDLDVQNGFEAGYKEAYNQAFSIGEMLGEATMKHKLLRGKSQGDDTDKEDGRDPAYLEAAKKIRGVLTDTADKEESNKKAYNLRDLQREVENVLKP
jgi:hypothetical protein